MNAQVCSCRKISNKLKVLTMKKLEKICLDLDGVVFNHLKAFCKKYNAIFYDTKTPDMITTWFFSNSFDITPDCLTRIFDMTDKTNYELFSEYIPDYIELIKQFYKIDILTCRDTKNRQATKISLEKNKILERSHYDNLFVLDYHVNKANFDYDIFIDDNPLLIDEMIKRPDKLLLLMNHKHNQDNRKVDNVIRVNNFYEIAMFLMTRYEIRFNKIKMNKKYGRCY